MHHRYPLQIRITDTPCIYTLHIRITNRHYKHTLQIHITSTHCIYTLQIHITNTHCIYTLHIYIAFIHCIYTLHIHIHYVLASAFLKGGSHTCVSRTHNNARCLPIYGQQCSPEIPAFATKACMLTTKPHMLNFFEGMRGLCRDMLWL